MNLILPEMGEGVIEATVGVWLKRLGDAVKRMEPIVEIETDKVTTEIVADENGIITTIFVEKGETVAVGTILAEIATGNIASEPASVTFADNQQDISDVTNPIDQTDGRSKIARGRRQVGNIRVSPVVARMAAEHELDLTQVRGTGKNERIMKRDVQRLLDESPQLVYAPSVKSTPSTNLSIDKPASSTVVGRDFLFNSKIVPLSPMRRAIAAHMVHSVQTSPHATTVHEVDFSAVAAHRKTHKQAFADKGVKLTFTAYMMCAVAEALEDFPLVNVSWSDEGIIVHEAINLGMATAVQNGAGLLVPVIKHASDLNLFGMARTVSELATKARDNRLEATDMQDGTFTVTNHGVSGSLFATPIINQPQACILGVGAIKKQVVVIEDAYGNDATVIRPIAYLSCSFDHRVLDGVSADRFVTAVVNKLECWR